MKMTSLQRAAKRSAALVLAGLLVAPLAAQTLVWSDEFDGPGLDLARWRYETGTGVNGDWGTCQLDAATDRPENVSVEQGVPGAEGGALAITTRRERYQVPGGGVRSYTSGRINTSGKASWGPGHKLRARVWPRDVRFEGQGFAFWAMPAEVPPGQNHLAWPQGGEIDIMEYSGLFAYNNLGTVHYAQQWAGNGWLEGNGRHLGAYYSYASEQVPEASPQWLYVDLGGPQPIARVVLRWEAAFGRAYQVQVSDDARVWTDLYGTTSGNGGVDDIAGLSGTGRYVRLYATARGTQWGYSLWEFEVYGPEGTNLALRRPTIASTWENAALAPTAATDGRQDTRWASGNLEAETGPRPPAPDDRAAGLAGWHVYGIDWYPDHLDFVVDEHVYHRHYFSDGGAFARDGRDGEAVRLVEGRRVAFSEYSNHFSEWHPFEHAFFVILSSGVGGSCTYGGAVGSEAAFPATVFVDWVRVYAMDTGTAAAAPAGGEAFGLLGYYPAPVRTTARIAYTLATDAPVTLELFNLLGQRVALLATGPGAPGRHEATLDASGLAPGVYTYTLRAGSAVQRRQLVVLR